ncbi:lipopolysaccharide core heptose(II) kinase RfaY [uncultured Helicobacter sp.]|uniref:lipopolysaccharide core heptose(II) kinase RfaY n=1 Tax=uncultured Helicobacter sp. TaxID=175537 RepID=UPI002618B978|nr:lipopolysaccharide core heptose(II) kinase RfaY [uncultured Helicobacter sp.]
MIFSKTISGYQVYLKENKAIYENIFNDYLNDCLKIIQVFKNTKESQVFLIASSGGGGEIIRSILLKFFLTKSRKKSGL